MINTEKRLVQMVDRAIEFGEVAIDTEFVWERTYYPSLGLIQIGYPDGGVDLVDTLAIGDFSPLARLLKSKKTTKILHDAIQDLKILSRISNATPLNIFDTQKAAGFIGFSASISLADLLRKTLSVNLEKTETKSNWMKRPLSKSQIDYASDDVRYGVKLMHSILEKAFNLDRLEWVKNEMKYYNIKGHYEEENPILAMPKVRNSGSLNFTQKNILRSINAFRESIAKKNNLVRSYVISDNVLMNLVRKPPNSLNDLIENYYISKNFSDQNIISLWESIELALKNKIPSLPQNKDHFQKDDGFESRVDLALSFLKGVSIISKIDPVLIANRSSITEFVRLVGERNDAYKEHALFKDWRKIVCGEKLYKLLNGTGSLVVDKDSGLPIYHE